MKNIFYYLLVLAPFCRAENDTLQLVHVFFRHGSRTPDLNDMYPTDPYGRESFSPIGYGGLTNEGKMTSFKLGQLLRDRYQNLLGDLYIPGMVDPISTAPERTRMSLLLVLAGLFPPASSQKWHDSLNWIPVPYHYEEASRDFSLRHPLFFCPAYTKELQRVIASAEIQKYFQDHSDFFKYLEEHTKKSTKTVLDVFLLYHTLYSEASMNLTLPEWTRSVYPDKMHSVASYRTFIETATPLLKKLHGGQMLGKVVNQMLAKTYNTLEPSNLKMILYSAHDYNIFTMLAAMDLLTPHMPEYSSSVLIELHLVENIYGVKIYYVRDPNSKPELQKLKNCNELCPLNQFVELTKDRIPQNYTAECESSVSFD